MKTGAGHWLFKPVFLATEEAEIRRIVVRSQLTRPYLKKPITKKNMRSSSRYRP
jgi:hypothetical protein